MLTWVKLLLILLFPLLPILSFAQTTPSGKICNAGSSLAWEMNTEADLAHYTVYHGPTPITATDQADVLAVQVPHDPNIEPDPATGKKTQTYPLTISTEGPRYFRATASDTSGNESPMSNEADCRFDFAPGAPTIELRFTSGG